MLSNNKNTSLAINLIAIVVGMLMLAYASVPLYRLFCQVTGFGGTPTFADHAPGKVGVRTITVRFNADIDPDLPWEFAPSEKELVVPIGEQRLTHYTAKNMSNKPVTGHAVYNVLPHKVGPYFAKIECFCFKNQTLPAGAKVNMPVSFFLDPALLDDPAMKDVTNITLSYTFFRAAK